jgi:hypothetical protein
LPTSITASPFTTTNGGASAAYVFNIYLPINTNIILNKMSKLIAGMNKFVLRNCYDKFVSLQLWFMNKNWVTNVTYKSCHEKLSIKSCKNYIDKKLWWQDLSYKMLYTKVRYHFYLFQKRKVIEKKLLFFYKKKVAMVSV